MPPSVPVAVAVPVAVPVAAGVVSGDVFNNYIVSVPGGSGNSPASVGRRLPGLRPRAARSAFGVLVAILVASGVGGWQDFLADL